MEKEKTRQGPELCPVGRFFSELRRLAGSESGFCEHMNQSRIEFLKAVRSLLDERIEAIQKKASKASPRKTTQIEVE